MGCKLESWFLRSSSPRALASFAAILGQELKQSQAKTLRGTEFKHRAHRERRESCSPWLKSLGDLCGLGVSKSLSLPEDLDEEVNTERTENAENNVLNGLRASVISVVSVFQFSWVFWL